LQRHTRWFNGCREDREGEIMSAATLLVVRKGTRVAVNEAVKAKTLATAAFIIAAGAMLARWQRA
jgi:hypothetical protein